MSQKCKINCRKNPSLTQPNRMHRYMSDFGRHTVQYVHTVHQAQKTDIQYTRIVAFALTVIG